MKYIALSLIVCFFIGSALGFLGAWIDHLDAEDTYSASVSKTRISHTEIYPIWEWVTVPPALPGIFTAMIRYPQDWEIDEEWDYRWTITVANGAVYVVLRATFLILRSLVRAARHRLILGKSDAR